MMSRAVADASLTDCLPRALGKYVCGPDERARGGPQIGVRNPLGRATQRDRGVYVRIQCDRTVTGL